MKSLLKNRYLKPLLISCLLTILATSVLVSASNLFTKDIPSHGVIVASSDLTTDKDTLEFGNVIQDSSSDIILTITNTSTVDLVVEITDDTDVNNLPSGVTLTYPTPVTILAGDYLDVIFTLTATADAGTGDVNPIITLTVIP